MSNKINLYDLSGHPDYASLVGQIFATWVRLEYRLCNLYAALMRSPPPRVVRLSILPPSGEPLEITGSHQDVAFTPDGTRIVYTATPRRLLVVRPLDQLEATPLRGSEAGSRNPFVSPDGNWVGFSLGKRSRRSPYTGAPR